MFRRPVKEINAEFLAEEKYLDSIQQIVREACATAGLRRKQISAVLLAIEEGATNIIRHAYLYEKGNVRLRIVIYKKMIVFSLIDTGRSFRPDHEGRLDLDKLVASGRRGGLGFYMVRKIMDSVEYISSAGRNELRMVKRIDAEPEQSPPLLRRLFNLRVRFSLGTFLIVSLIITAVYYYVNTTTRKHLYDDLDATATALATTIADQASGYILNKRTDVEFDRLTVSYKNSNPFIAMIAITDSANIVLAHSEDTRNIRKPYRPPAIVPSGPPGQPRRVLIGEKPVNYLMLPIRSGRTRLGTVHMFYSSALITSRLEKSWHRSLLLTAALLVFGIFGIYLLSSYFVTPIIRITRRVRRFSSGDLESELPLEGADEFFEISRALNEMMTRLSHDRENIVEREKMAKEIEVASQIQKTLLPRNLPALQGMEVDSFYRAASLVGGDLYDMFPVDDERYCCVVADVSGKGVPASLVMSMLRTVIQIHARDTASAREILLPVHEYLSDNIPPGMFITVLLALLDARASKLSFVSAGHNPILHYQAATHRVSKINPAGMPLGVPVTLGKSFAETLEELELILKPGDVILLYTDGITDTTNRDGVQFGTERLERFLIEKGRDFESSPIAKLARALVDEIDNFSGFTKQNDDITFLLLRTCTGRGSESDDTSPLESDTIRDSDMSA